MAIAAGLAAIHYVRASANVDDLQKEMEEDYAINAANYEVDYARATETLENMTSRVEEQQNYIYDSIYLNLDDRNVLSTSVDMYLIMEANDYTRKSYLSLCADGIMSKLDWEKLAAKYEENPTYLEELVKVEPDYDHGTITIRVLYPDETVSGEILDLIISNMKSVCNEYSFLGEATFEYVNRCVKHEIDDELALAKKDAQKLLDEYVNQLAAGQEQVDAFYAPTFPSFKKDFWKKAIKKSLLLVIAAMLAGVVCTSMYYYSRYIRKGIIYDASEYRRLTGVEMLGCFDGKNDNLTCRNIAIKLASQSKKTILLAGNMSLTQLDKYKTDLKYQFDSMNVAGIDFLTSDTASDDNFIAKLYTAEAVVFVVERQKTTLKDYLVWQQAATDAKKDLIGNIIL